MSAAQKRLLRVAESESMECRAFVISLERAKQRFENAKQLLPKLQMPAEVVPAVDGRALEADDISRLYQKSLHRPSYPFELNVGEVGCFLSHRSVWQAIVDRNLDAGLILEDDVQVDPQQFAAVIQFLKSSCPDDGFVQLPVRVLPKAKSVILQQDSIALCCPSVTPLRTSGQWVTKAAAEKLLAATEPFDRPVDTFLQMYWISGVQLLAVEPSGIADGTANVGGSTIGDSKGSRRILKNVSREFKRTWYRWQVRRLSKSHAGRNG